MNQDKQFCLENLLMSVIGHLVLIAVMVTSFAILVHRAMLVAPDRIEIMEIDLDSVSVSRDDTKLYNTAPPEEKKAEKKAKEKAKAEPEKIESEKSIEKPSMVDSEQDKKKEEKKPEQKTDPEQVAPKKKMVVRVNRETVSLNRSPATYAPADRYLLPHV